MQALSSLRQERPYSQKRTIPTNEKKWTAIHAHSRYGGDLAVSVSKLVTTMLRHYGQDERQRDASRHWDSIIPLLMKAYAQNLLETLMMDIGHA